jgi:hypothetical protein
MAGAERLPISAQTASVDSGREMIRVRQILEGSARQVLRLKANNLNLREIQFTLTDGVD